MNQLNASRFNTPQGDRTAISTPTMGNSSRKPCLGIQLDYYNNLQVAENGVDFSDAKIRKPFIDIAEVPSTATSGQLMPDQLATLNSAPYDAYIMFFGEKFIPQSIQADLWVYTNYSQNASVATSKFFSLNPTTRTWSINQKTETKERFSPHANPKINKNVFAQYGASLSVQGNNVWSDGIDTYYSNGSSTQFKWDRANKKWVTMEWGTFTNIYGNYIWTDGSKIYYSNGTTQYYKEFGSAVWISKAWESSPNLNNNITGYNIWYMDGHIYYSMLSSIQYELVNGAFVEKTWNGYTHFTGESIWTDGIDYYISAYANQYKFNKTLQKWESHLWGNNTPPGGDDIWSDGTDIYVNSGAIQYKYNKQTKLFENYAWTNGSFNGKNIWTDGEDIYLGQTSIQQKLIRNRIVSHC